MKLPDEIREFFQRQGRIGGRKRSRTLSAEQRSEIARKAAVARWANKKQGGKGKRGDSRTSVN